MTADTRNECDDTRYGNRLLIIILRLDSRDIKIGLGGAQTASDLGALVRR